MERGGGLQGCEDWDVCMALQVTMGVSRVLQGLRKGSWVPGTPVFPSSLFALWSWEGPLGTPLGLVQWKRACPKRVTGEETGHTGTVRAVGSGP